jgi:prepilin-type N-terminal cleavage/methylation domain-containing protein
MSARRRTPHLTDVRAGFTLVELLVVIGIIALLLAILMPALSRARESARRICLSDLKQLGTALMFYTQENKGRFPGAWEWHPRLNGTTWEGPLVRYHGISNAQVPKLYTCPSDDPETRRPGRYPFCYTGNWHVFWFDPGRSVVKIT